MAFPTGWNRRAPLVIQSSLVLALLSDFPLLLTKDTLPSEMLDADGTYPAQNGGGDIRFSSDSAGVTQLACEVVSFVTNNDPALGSAEIWVKVPSVSASVNTTIYVWYNTAGTDSQPAVTGTYGRNAVWGAYLAVYHGAGLTDATGNGYDLTGTVSSADGPFGQAFSFDGSGSNVLSQGGLQSPLGGATQLSVSAWMMATSVARDQRAFGIFPTTSTRRRFGFWMDRDGAGPSWAFTATTDPFLTNQGESPANASVDAWAFVHGTFAQNSIHAVYKDGAVTDSEAVGATTVLQSGGTRNLTVGRWDLDTNYFTGRIGGIRIGIHERSANWIDAEHNSQSDPATFVIEGTPESTATGPTITNVPNMTIGIQATITGTGFGT